MSETVERGEWVMLPDGTKIIRYASDDWEMVTINSTAGIPLQPQTTSPVLPCPKCGAYSPEAHYVAARENSWSGEIDQRLDEHLWYRCRVCKYAWDGDVLKQKA